MFIGWVIQYQFAFDKYWNNKIHQPTKNGKRNLVKTYKELKGQVWENGEPVWGTIKIVPIFTKKK